MTNDPRFPSRVNVWFDTTVKKYIEKNQDKESIEKLSYFANSVFTSPGLKQISVTQSLEKLKENYKKTEKGILDFIYPIDERYLLDDVSYKVLESEHDFYLEGEKMHNCMETEYEDSEERLYFSLRRNGKSFINLTLVNHGSGEWFIEQCKGPINKQIKDEDLVYLNKILELYEVETEDFTFDDLKMYVFRHGKFIKREDSTLLFDGEGNYSANKEEEEDVSLSLVIELSLILLNVILIITGFVGLVKFSNSLFFLQIFVASMSAALGQFVPHDRLYFYSKVVFTLVALGFGVYNLWALFW